MADQPASWFKSMLTELFHRKSGTYGLIDRIHSGLKYGWKAAVDAPSATEPMNDFRFRRVIPCPFDPSGWGAEFEMWKIDCNPLRASREEILSEIENDFAEPAWYIASVEIDKVRDQHGFAPTRWKAVEKHRRGSSLDFFADAVREMEASVAARNAAEELGGPEAAIEHGRQAVREMEARAAARNAAWEGRRVIEFPGKEHS